MCPEVVKVISPYTFVFDAPSIIEGASKVVKIASNVVESDFRQTLSSNVIVVHRKLSNVIEKYIESSIVTERNCHRLLSSLVVNIECGSWALLTTLSKVSLSNLSNPPPPAHRFGQSHR